MSWIATHKIKSYFIGCALIALGTSGYAISQPYTVGGQLPKPAAIVLLFVFVFVWAVLLLWIFWTPVWTVQTFREIKNLPPNFRMINCANPTHSTNDLLREQNRLLQNRPDLASQQEAYRQQAERERHQRELNRLEATTEIYPSWPMPSR